MEVLVGHDSFKDWILVMVNGAQKYIVLLSVTTCGTSMLSVGRVVASLLLRGSNSNAAVKTMANPAGQNEWK